jgi:hypothetical protein
MLMGPAGAKLQISSIQTIMTRARAVLGSWMGTCRSLKLQLRHVAEVAKSAFDEAVKGNRMTI